MEDRYNLIPDDVDRGDLLCYIEDKLNDEPVFDLVDYVTELLFGDVDAKLEIEQWIKLYKEYREERNA